MVERNDNILIIQYKIISGSVKLHIGDSWGKPETQTLEGGGRLFENFPYDKYLINGSHFSIFS